MKKKALVVLALAAVLVLGAFSVNATGSGDSSNGAVVAAIIAAQQASQDATATADNGTAVSTEALPATTVQDATAQAASVLSEAGVGTASTSYSVLASYDVSLTAGTLPATITFKVAGVTAGSKVYILHKTASGAWEYIATTVGNGTVTGTFTSLSPVVIVEANDGATSPKTGEF